MSGTFGLCRCASARAQGDHIVGSDGDIAARDETAVVPRIVVNGVGNEFRHDDGMGRAVIERVREYALLISGLYHSGDP